MAWIEIAGEASLSLFATIVVVLLGAGVAGRAWELRRAGLRTAGRTGGRSFPRRFDGFDRFLREYIGNAALDDEDSPVGCAISDERRDNREARELVDRIIAEMDRSHVPTLERDAFLDELRRAIHAEERLGAVDLECRETERRYLETQRWALAERFHGLVRDPHPEIVARIRAGFSYVQETAACGTDADT